MQIACARLRLSHTRDPGWQLGAIMPGIGQELRLLNSDELVLGGPLPGDLCDRADRVLIRAGQVLTDEHLQLLGKRLIAGIYGGEGWGSGQPEEEASLDEVMKELYERHGAAKATDNQRAHGRHNWTVPLEAVLEEPSAGGPIYRKIEVTTVNISRAGFAFVFQQFIAPGTVVRAQFASLPNRPRLKGIVRSCMLLGGNQHRVGVQFADTEQTGDA